MQFKDFVKQMSKTVEVSNYMDTRNEMNEQGIDRLPKDQLLACFAQTTWITGGMCGNNCYDYLNKQIDAEAPIDVAYAVAQALLKMDIEGVSYDTLDSLVKTKDLSDEPDYYGNYALYTRAYISLKELYTIFFKVQ